MPAKSNKQDKGAVGILYGGSLKQNHIYVFKNDSCELTEFATNLVQYFSNEFNIKYAPVDDYDNYYETFLNKLDDKKRLSDTSIFKLSIAETSNDLREVCNVKNLNSFSLNKEDKPKKKTTKGKKEGSGEEDNVDDEDTKPKKKTTKGKKEESDVEDNEDEEDTKPKKKTTKGKKEDSGEEDNVDDEDTKSKKKTTKGKKEDSGEEDNVDDEDTKPKKKTTKGKKNDDNVDDEDDEDNKDKKLKKKDSNENKSKSKSK
jgi:hypothetical protein